MEKFTKTCILKWTFLTTNFGNFFEFVKHVPIQDLVIKCLKKNSKQTKDKLWIFFSNENNSKINFPYIMVVENMQEKKKLVNSLLSVNYHYYYYTVYFYFWQKFEWKKECFKELSFMITTKKLPLSYYLTQHEMLWVFM